MGRLLFSYSFPCREGELCVGGAFHSLLLLCRDPRNYLKGLGSRSQSTARNPSRGGVVDGRCSANADQGQGGDREGSEGETETEREEGEARQQGKREPH